MKIEYIVTNVSFKFSSFFDITQTTIFLEEVWLICFKIGLRPLTQRRVSHIIGEFELIGIINTKTISKGRYGRTREITLSIPSSVLPLTKKILEEELVLT